MRRHIETVQYKSLFGTFRKMPRDIARKLALADYDSSPMTGTATCRANINLRIKGATIEEFLLEREEGKKYAMYSQAGG